MADAVTTNIQISTRKIYTVQFTNISDGTGESAVQKVDVSALEGATSSTRVRIRRIWSTISGMAVKVLFDHDTDDLATIVDATTGDKDYTPFGGIKDPGSAGGTGDILFTTVSHTAGDYYSIILELGLM